MTWYEPIIDTGLVPDFVTRFGIRHLLNIRLGQITEPTFERQLATKSKYVDSLKQAPIAIHTDKANEQHYEVPTEFIKACLGRHMKYSCCFFPEGVDDLDTAEELMLESYCVKARLEDGQDVLDLGCGWGSLALFLSAKYPKSTITALSNSSTQREYIEKEAASRGLSNLRVVTGDVKDYQFIGNSFDRICSIEMFEHMKNYRHLFQKVNKWLRPQGLLFLHVFCHKDTPYDFTTEDDHSWMAKYFFTGGTMPSSDLFLYFQEEFKLVNMWYLSGEHYAKTSEAWLKKLDRSAATDPKIMKSLEACYGSAQAANVWLQRWRIFYLSVAELFNFNQGQTWGVVHYLFEKKL